MPKRAIENIIKLNFCDFKTFLKRPSDIHNVQKTYYEYILHFYRIFLTSISFIALLLKSWRFGWNPQYVFLPENIAF